MAQQGSNPTKPLLDSLFTPAVCLTTPCALPGWQMSSFPQEEQASKLFDAIDTDGGGTLDIDEFVTAFQNVNPTLTEEQCRKIFDEADVDGSGDVDFDEFVQICTLGAGDMLKMLGATNRDASGVLQVAPSEEKYFGEKLRAEAPKSVNPFSLVESQAFSMQLYESRIASLQRFVAMSVMFHELGKRVQDFWPAWTFGYLGYRIDRTHSIMRIATTASPVSGAEVRDRINYLTMRTELEKALAVISTLAKNYKQRSHLMSRLASMQGRALNVSGAGMEKFITKKSAKEEVVPKRLETPSDMSISTEATQPLQVSGRNPQVLLEPVVSAGTGNDESVVQQDAFVELPHTPLPHAGS